jgi:antitoxin ParD1/3/4
MLSDEEEFPMATMNVSLPDEMKAFVETQAAKEGFGTTSEYLRSVIRDVQKRQAAKQVIEAKLREALESGPAEPMTRGDWDELERKVWERHHREQGRS